MFPVPCETERALKGIENKGQPCCNILTELRSVCVPALIVGRNGVTMNTLGLGLVVSFSSVVVSTVIPRSSRCKHDKKGAQNRS